MRISVENEIINQEDAQIVKYGLEIILLHIISTFLLIIVGILLGQVDISIVYLIVLVLLRKNTGGYHCKTFLTCLCTTGIGLILIIGGNKIITEGLKEIIGIIFILYAMIKIYLSTPRLSKNRMISEKVVQQCHKNKDKGLLILVGVSFILHSLSKTEVFMNYDYFYAISSSLMIVAFTMNGRWENNEKINKNGIAEG